MSWQLVARKDLRDSIRRYHLHIASILTVLILGGTAYTTSRTFRGEAAPPEAVVGAVATVATFLIPLIAVGFSQGTVVGMRERGDLKLLLGLPFSRRDVVLGAFSGRFAFLMASLLIGLGIGTVVAIARGAGMAFDTLLFVTAMLAVLTAVFVALAIGISAAVSTETRAGALAIGTYFVFVFQLWSVVPFAALWVLSGFGLPSQVPTWVHVIINVNPVVACWNVVVTLLPGGGSFVADMPASPPFYRTLPVALAVLAAWIAGPLALGYRRFAGTDL
jgi:ABC-type transport system involved in multi-copper enzyme maturation permease subunit